MTTILNASTVTIRTAGLRGPIGPAGDVNVDGWEEIASATTVDLSTTDSDFVLITGSEEIESLGTTPNLIKFCRVSQAPTLIYSDAIRTPGLLDRELAAGDWFLAMSDADGDWWIRIFRDETVAVSTIGLLVRAAPGVWVTRSIAKSGAGLAVTNGDGVSGDPTVALANDVAALEALGGTGFAARTAADTWAQRTITGTANEIAVTNPAGVAGNPVLSLPVALAFAGKTVTGGTFDAPSIIHLTDPTNSQDAATKAYADATVSSEAGTRAAADSALQGAIDAEAATRASADGVLVTAIDSEETDRLAADAALQADIDADVADLASHVADAANPHDVTKAQVGLDQVNNTSDADKPVSTAAQTALDLKAAAADLTSHTGNTSNPHSVTKAQVGLGDADDTADADKPISTATQDALDDKAPLANPSFTGKVIVPTYTVGTLPSAAAGGVIYVNNGAAGAPVLAFSDGSSWLRADTLAPVAVS